MSRLRLPMVRTIRIVGLLGLVLSLLVPSPAHAATTCTYNPAKHLVSISGDTTVFLARDGDDIATLAAPLDPLVPCTNAAATETATVHNTDLIKVALTGSAHFGLDQILGPLRPGFTDEPGTSDEIEISLDLDRLLLRGTTTADRMVLGRDGINLNAGEPDDDLDITGITNVLQVDGSNGNDFISLRGGSATGPGIDPEIGILGDQGNDTILAYHDPLPGDGLVPVGPHMTIDGGDGRDHIEGSAWEDQIDGGSGNDYIDGGEMEDDLDGEDGNNTVAFKVEGRSAEVDLAANSASIGSDLESVPGFSNVVGSRDDDRFEGDGGANRFEGGGGRDVMVGDTGVDEMLGQKGDDVFHASAESETLAGGPGSDAVTYFSDDMDEINLSTGQSSSPGGGDTLDSIENVSADDPVTVVGNAKANHIQVNPGPADVFAGGGPDRIETGSAMDTLRGQGGNDFFRGGTGGGPQLGGPGADEFTSSSGDDSFSGGPGRDLANYQFTFSALQIDLRITGPQATGGGTDTIAGVEDILGSFMSDRLTGNSRANKLNGFIGDDLVVGGGGNDVVTGWQGEDDLLGGPGRDAVSFADTAGRVKVDLAETERQDTNVGWDTMDQFENVIGSAFNDLLRGDSGPNKLSGGAGNDRLFGRNGADGLLGQAGNDDLFGGPGADSCVGGPGTDSLDNC